MNLKALLNKGESENVEFKKSLQLKDEIGEAVSAFSNTEGGTIIVGFDESKDEVIGIELGNKTIENLANYIKQHTDSPVFPQIRVDSEDNKEIIVIEVNEADEKPVLFKGRAYKRVGKSSHRIPAGEIRKLVVESKKVYWDGRVCEGATLNDIGEEKINWFLEERFSARKVPSPAQMDISDFLRNNACAKIVNKEVMLTNSGVLFFSKNPQMFIPFRILCARFRGDELSRTTIDSLDCSGTLWEMLKLAEEFIRKNVRLFGFRTGLSFRRIDKLEYPVEAIREIILNALIHRDYTIPSDIRIFVFDSRIEVINPGSFPEGVTPQKPLHIPRNPILCQLVREIGYIEKYGTGIYFVRDLCNEWGIPEPEFKTGGLETRVIFRSSGEGILIPEMKKRGIELNDRQAACLQYLAENPYITNKMYQELNNVGKKAAYLDIQYLLKKGLVAQEGKGRSVRYMKKF